MSHKLPYFKACLYYTVLETNKRHRNIKKNLRPFRHKLNYNLHDPGQYRCRKRYKIFLRILISSIINYNIECLVLYRQNTLHNISRVHKQNSSVILN